MIRKSGLPLAVMYFKSVIRRNPETARYEGYYRLVESYRNVSGRICHRPLLTIGFLPYEVEKLNDIRRILTDRLNRTPNVFEQGDEEAVRWADIYWQQLVESGKIDVSDRAYEEKKRMVNIDELLLKDGREAGAEWMCYQGMEQLRFREKLEEMGWEEEQIRLAFTQIISRAVYPHSELRTTRWIQENSAVCEITGYPMEKITKDKLYQSALDLYRVKDRLEAHLSKRTNELFDLQDKIILYDLTNTYFEGEKKGSNLARFGRSKEKRSDARLIVLALVVNAEGFIKYSDVFEGNMSDSSSLPGIIDRIRVRTAESQCRAIVVLDAGIATEENLALIRANGYDYVCVSRTKIKDYAIGPEGKVCKVNTKNDETVTLERVQSAGMTDYLLKISSPGKALKESSMKNQFESRFLQEIEKIRQSLEKKHGVKKIDKVHQRIGRAIEKYPSAARFYSIEVRSEQDTATEIILTKKENSIEAEERLGVYFIRTSLKTEGEETLWIIYNTIREVESAFRCLKTDLDLRPVYHKNDDATLAHLYLGLLAYSLVNTIRYQLKAKGIHHDWQEIVRITNTQKVVTTYGKNNFGETIYVRRCTDPNEKVKTIYQALGYRNYPFVKRKSVVHKSEFKKNQFSGFQQINDG